MSFFIATHVQSLKGEVSVPGDKSIAHRSLIISALAKGKTTIKNFPYNDDCFATVKAFRKLGISITPERLTADSHTITVSGRGLRGLRRPHSEIFVKESGTTLRLLLGVLAGCAFTARLTTGKSLSRRPMLRVTAPLRQMGASIRASRRASQGPEEYPPITIHGGNLKPLCHKMAVASAQVKSAILLAGLFIKEKTQVIEQIKTRDHTERMLGLFKADVKVIRNKIVIKGGKELTSPGLVIVPGDISSAGFFIVLGIILSDSKIVIKNVSLNASRIGLIQVLKRMNASITVRHKAVRASREPIGDIIAESSRLKGVRVRKHEIPALIDELPILMVAAACAKGESVFEGVEELRVKETDRIHSMSENLTRMGARIRCITADQHQTIVIQAGSGLTGTTVRSFGDHRTAMSMVVAGLKADGQTRIEGVSCIAKSFPGFLDTLNTLIEQ